MLSKTIAKLTGHKSASVITLSLPAFAFNREYYLSDATVCASELAGTQTVHLTKYVLIAIRNICETDKHLFKWLLLHNQLDFIFLNTPNKSVPQRIVSPWTDFG